jgi:hypothetical protein
MNSPSFTSEQLQAEGVKDDSQKIRLDLIPVVPLFLLGDVYTRGAKKYADHNWRKGIKWSRIFAALLRHAWKWFNGEKCDPEDGQHHLASVAWCAFTLMEYELSHPEMDDRPEQVPYEDYKKLCHSGFAHSDLAAPGAKLEVKSFDPQTREIEPAQALCQEDVAYLERLGFMVRHESSGETNSVGRCIQ